MSFPNQPPISIIFILDFRRSVCYTIANALIYFEGILFLLKAFPKTFTFGEVNIAIQGLSLFIHSLFSQLNKVMLQGIPQNEHYISSIILLVSLHLIFDKVKTVFFSKLGH